MKNLLLAIVLITGFAACKSDPDLSNQDRDIHLLYDSTAYNNNVFFRYKFNRESRSNSGNNF